ncbi:MAG: hypothetical protein AB7S68_37525, partial [Polyangiaceae bacterium]
FALHGDPKSRLVYDLLFDLYASAHAVTSAEAYLELYPSLLALGDGEVTTHGYAPGFIAEWLKQRVAAGLIRTENGRLTMSDEHRAQVLQALGEYA